MGALYVRSLTAAEKAAVHKAIRSSNAVTHRRARIIALSEAGRRVTQIADAVGMHADTVRRVIRAVNAGELTAQLGPRPKRTGRPPTFGPQVAEGLEQLLHRPPKDFGFETARWTLQDLATAARMSGLVERIDPSTVWRILLSRGKSWKQAKRRMSSPDPEYEQKKG